MLLDVLVPTNGHLSKLQPLLESISRQTLQPDRLVILIHKHLTKEEFELFQYFVQKALNPSLVQKIFIISNLTAEYEPGQWVGADRNELLKHAKSKFIYMIDQDNIFWEDLFEKTADRYLKIKEQVGSDVIISPTIMRRDSGNVQSQGITNFRYIRPKYTFGKMWAEHWHEVKMVGANSLFGPREIFREHGFDYRFRRCYEDIDFTYRVHLAWTPIIVLNKVEIYHMEATKNKLQQRFLGDPVTAYERSRNRILRVKKTAKRFQKIQYFWVWLRAQTVWFYGAILLYGGWQRIALRKAIRRGLKDGLRV